ncbi:MAG: helix-turn-helix transcriptional regulator [Bdellovibrionota bacterium]|nr:helix-turn-helix transcriptional regulator [Bdellovibrionota bacterium]MEC8625149.1 helix-turn-helix transcriptional regulator [Bdellovibrionota bacterium]
MDEINIGKTLSHLMKEKKLTFKKLSELSGLPMSTLKGWAANIEPKSMISVRKVSRVLGVTSEFLIFGEDSENTVNLDEILTHKVFSGWAKITIETPISTPKLRNFKTEDDE